MQTLLNQLVYFGFFQSLFLLLIYLFSSKKRKQINGYMTFFVGILFIGLSGKVLHGLGVWGGNFRLISLSELSALLFGPTVYLFTRSVLERKKYSHQELIHYIPALIYSVFIAVYFVIPSDAIISERIKTGELMHVVYVCNTIGLVFNISYLFLAFKTYQNFSRTIKDEVSYEVHTQFILNFLWIIAACLVFWVVIFMMTLFGDPLLERKVRPYIWIVLTLVILFITYAGIVSPQVFRILPDKALKKYHQSKLTLADMDRLKEKLDSLMLEKKPYLNKKLLKAELAEMLGVSNPELARLLNENIGMNFFEYVNYYRIREFVNLVKTEKVKQLTFFGVAQEAGFNSKTTFNKAFKKLMGTSPSHYFSKGDEFD